MKVIKLTPDEIVELSFLASKADVEHRTLRVSVDGNSAKFKLGEGMWTPPMGEVEVND